MANKPNNNSPLDEEYLRNLMASGTAPSGRDERSGGTEEPAGQSGQNDTVSPGRRITKERIRSFAESFITSYSPETRQGVYIDREWHRKISAIVGIVGKRKLTVGNYIDNVLKYHFEQYGEEIKAVCSQKFNKIL